MGINESIKAVCFPTGSAAAASFDRELIEKMGQALGNECQAENVAVILGPAVNIKRSPLCGRNFEYYSEDPLVASETAKHFIKGVQSKNVGTSIKHFYANNQEHRRMSSSSCMDERTAREIYLAAFENAVKEAKPWTVMCSYNRINGTYAADDKNALTDILRGEWGFDGYVVSDWGAVSDRCTALEAGIEQEVLKKCLADTGGQLIQPQHQLIPVVLFLNGGPDGAALCFVPAIGRELVHQLHELGQVFIGIALDVFQCLIHSEGLHSFFQGAHFHFRLSLSGPKDRFEPSIERNFLFVIGQKYAKCPIF
jgi:hypothetical protein